MQNLQHLESHPNSKFHKVSHDSQIGSQKDTVNCAPLSLPYGGYFGWDTEVPPGASVRIQREMTRSDDTSVRGLSNY